MSFELKVEVGFIIQTVINLPEEYDVIVCDFENQLPMKEPKKLTIKSNSEWTQLLLKENEKLNWWEKVKRKSIGGFYQVISL